MRPPRRSIAFVTSSEDPDLTPDDRLALAPLEELGTRVVPRVWDDVLPHAEPLDGIVLRSCWDSHLKPERFSSWLGGLAHGAPPVWNPVDVAAWNVDKKYLLALEAEGVAIPRTARIPRGTADVDRALEAILDELASHEYVVIKPSVSLNGHDTFLVCPRDRDHARRIVGAIRGDALVQEFLPEIRESGEISFVFFDGRFSHAIVKLPAANDFRVQVEHGGRRAPIDPPHALVVQAEEILARIDTRLLYARVDGVVRGGRLVLMELELIDPMLFLGWSEGAPGRFAKAVASFFR
jgi:glutathione synthase/RimK-type ligase-like ATP-grasp enzyme